LSDEGLYGYSLEDFKEEAREILERAEGILNNMHEEPDNPEWVNALFRAIHSLKGSAAYVGQPEVNSFSHLYESFLGEMRSKKYTLDDEAIVVLVRARDYLEDLIFNSEHTEPVKIDDSIEDVRERIGSALKRSALGEGTASQSKEPTDAPKEAAQASNTGQLSEDTSEQSSESEEAEKTSEAITQTISQAIPSSNEKEAEAVPPPQLSEEIAAGESTAAPYVPGTPEVMDKDHSDMDQTDVIRLTITQSLDTLYSTLQEQAPDSEELERLLGKLEDTVVWAFGDDAANVVISLEEMRGLIEQTEELGSKEFSMLKKGFQVLAPALKKELAILSGEVLYEENEMPEETLQVIPQNTEEADRIRGASRDDIVKITLAKTLDSLEAHLNDEPLDPILLKKSLERLEDLNRWAFSENAEVTSNINSMKDLLARSGEASVLKELIARERLLRSVLMPLVNIIDEESDSTLDINTEAIDAPLNLATDALPSTPPAQTTLPEAGKQGRAGTMKRAAIVPQTTQTLKVKSEELEELIGTVGGLKGLDSAELEKLQAATLQLRMVPVGELFNRFRKVVRDLSEELNKSIKIEISGETVKLDKVIADKLGEPLLHMVRNAAGHGLESVAERAAAGKGHAVIRLNALQEGGQIIIEVSDNGRGISLDAVKKKGLENGLITEEELPNLTERKILDLIFAPGFSTKDGADSISGRGVGMDVVKNAIGSLQGAVTIETKEGVGTTFRLQMPLTLAIIKGMVLEQSGNKIAVPAASVDRIINMTEKELEEGCFMDKNRLSLYMPDEGEVIPVVNFSKLFNFKSIDEKRCVVLLKIGAGHKVALIVDAAVGRQPLTVKPLDKFSETKYFSSVSMIEEEVVLILNIPSLMAA
jgi:chemotaxis protein histidine kinase CheA